MYKPTIGLEIHSQLKTKTKMFCGCLNDPEEKMPNKSVCPVCLAHPGTLPVANKSAIEAVIRLGMTLGSTIAAISKFDRKNYFYPDLPKGYQISQYDKPLVSGGELCGVRITRVHLEEDTGRIQHLMKGQLTAGEREESNVKSQMSDVSLIDFNRAGVPLMELVTEPDIKNGEQAVRFAKELQLILRYLGISDADMEKGQMRVEVNISLRPTDYGLRQENPDIEGSPVGKLGTKVEIKNLNSFRSVGEAIDYEIKRQTEILKKGEKVIQETRGWDDVKKITKSQRLKEESHDYRYFPEPDLPPLDLRKFNLDELQVSVPELPAAKRVRFKKEYGLSDNQAEILISDLKLADYFEKSASELKSLIPAASYLMLYNYLTTDLAGILNQKGDKLSNIKVTPEHLAHLIVLIDGGKLSSRMAKDALLKMFETGLDPEAIVEKEGMVQVSDESELEAVVKEIITGNNVAVSDYKKGKENALQFLVGQAMGKLKGRGNPEILREVFKKNI